MLRVAILTVSDSVARGTREDVSGNVAEEWCSARGDTVADRRVEADDSVAIARRLIEWCDDAKVDLVLTTGGTGLAPRDVTPEATRAVIERDAPGIAERLRVKFVDSFPRAALSRGISGTRGSTLIVNLPGSPKGVRDSLEVLALIVDHAHEVLTTRTPHPEPAVPDAR